MKKCSNEFINEFNNKIYFETESYNTNSETNFVNNLFYKFLVKLKQLLFHRFVI